MEYIGRIRILSATEIDNKGVDILNKDKDNKYLQEKYVHLYEASLPFKLFRLNEMTGFELNGEGCEISEEQYMDRLECLPPEPFKKDIIEGWKVPEPITHKFGAPSYEYIFKYNGKYFCVVMAEDFKVI